MMQQNSDDVVKFYVPTWTVFLSLLKYLQMSSMYSYKWA